MITFTLNNLNVYGVYAKLLQLCLILCNPTECTSLVAQTVKNPPAMRKTWVQSLGWEDPLEKSMDRAACQATVHGVAKSRK